MSAIEIYYYPVDTRVIHNMENSELHLIDKNVPGVFN